MPRRNNERRAAKRQHEGEDEATTSKRINVESPLHPALKPKAGNLAANRLTALRKRLCDTLAPASEKPAKPFQGTSSSVCAGGTISPKEQFTKYPLETAIKRLENSRRKLNGTVIVIDDSPSPAKDKHKAQFDSPQGFIVLSEAEDSVRNETPLVSANERLRKFRSNSLSLSPTSSSKTLTPDSGEKLNSSVVYVKTSRATIIPKANLFKSPKHADVVNGRATDVERLQKTPAKSLANVPRIAENECPGMANLIPKKSPITEMGSSPMGNRRAAIKNEIGAGSSTGKTVKSSLADRLAKIRDSKAPIERASATVNEDTSKDVLKCTSISRAALVEEWMDSAPPTACCNEFMSDSLEVHLNDTILGRSELLSESRADESMDWDEIPEPSNTPMAPKALPDEAKRNIICLVTDTNVFMHDLPKVQELLNFKIVGSQKLIIYIPWMVLKELDHFKDNSSRNSSMKSQALTAQKLINSALLEPNSKVVGQSVNDVCQQMDLGKDPDDKILACCLQAKTKYTTVVLLSNDINLRNKALTNDLKTYSPRELVAKLKCNKFVKIKVKLQGLLSQIVFQCCKEVYGDACSKMEMLANCPWSFEGCLRRFRRYWDSVFKELLLKHCLKTVEELIRITDRGDVADSNSSEFDRFKSKIKELLFFLQDIEKYNAAAKKMRVEMDNIGEDDCIL
ncbi:uncharacterized protein LOC109543289 isoform X1 [Dendroctonus ponderosae]|uniref:uncharacterized protein LOC109543289 isoform X1 n=1 Tax=Dendroctonus ponderosae TaxID=77166 RepID=UPI002035060D|nr:uncharacterized protein LOC109543289 isoform X1 [Dendroctonus ponderosae]